MPTNPLLVAVSIAYGICGLMLLFVPDVIMSRLAAQVPPVAIWIAGMFGGAPVAMALLNWRLLFRTPAAVGRPPAP